MIYSRDFSSIRPNATKQSFFLKIQKIYTIAKGRFANKHYKKMKWNN